MIVTYILSAISIILLLLLIILIFKFRKGGQDLLLHQKIDSIREEFTKNIFQAQSDLFNTQKGIAEELNKLYKEIGNINIETGEILGLTKSFSDILKPTKRRGILGESILENIIADVLPKEMVFPQYSFRNGKTVDFLIRLPQGSLAVDAKFSLESFKNYTEADSDNKDKLKKIFVDSIKRRVDETAEYILPDEGTLDFSFMYVPSEAVYYFIVTETDALDYSNKKRVFLVGPNTFYVYLKTLFVGFKALQIEKKAKLIYEGLKRLELELENLTRDYAILGTHLKSALSKYEDARRRLERAQLKLANIKESEPSEDENKIKSHP